MERMLSGLSIVVSHLCDRPGRFVSFCFQKSGLDRAAEGLSTGRCRMGDSSGFVLVYCGHQTSEAGQSWSGYHVRQ